MHKAAVNFFSNADNKGNANVNWLDSALSSPAFVQQPPRSASCAINSFMAFATTVDQAIPNWSHKKQAKYR